MKVLFHKKFQKFVAKVKNEDLRSLIQSEVDKVVKDPSLGKVLEHPFRKYDIRSVGFVHNKNSFRIAYTKNAGELIFLLIDARENFYKKLERMV